MIRMLMLGLLCAAAACSSRPPAPGPALVGTWEATAEPRVRVTYKKDGTWESRFVLEGQVLRGNGTWEIVDGVIQNNTLEHDPIPGAEPMGLPYLSEEKLVTLTPEQYSYVCPVQGCTNTMRRVRE